MPPRLPVLRSVPRHPEFKQMIEGVPTLLRDLRGTANFFKSRVRCEQQTVRGRLVYIIGWVPLSYQSLSHVMNALIYKRPGAVLLGEWNQQHLGPCVNLPHCKTEMSSLLSRILYKPDFTLTREQIYNSYDRGLLSPDWLISIAHFITQLPHSHVLIAKPKAELLTRHAITHWHSSLPAFFQKAVTALQLQPPQLFTIKHTHTLMFEHAAKRLHSGTLYRHLAFRQSELIKDASHYKDPFLVTHEDVLQRITQILEKRLNQQYPCEDTSISETDLPMAIAYCSLFYNYNLSLASNQAWISRMTDYDKVLKCRQFLEDSFQDMAERGDPPSPANERLTTAECVQLVKRRFNKEQRYQILSLSQRDKLNQNQKEVARRMQAQLRSLGLTSRAQEVSEFLAGKYTFQNIETYSKLIGKFAIKYGLQLKLPRHHYAQFMPYYSSFISQAEIDRERAAQIERQQKKLQLPAVDNSTPISQLQRQGFQLESIVSQGQGGQIVTKKHGEEGFNQQLQSILRLQNPQLNEMMHDPQMQKLFKQK